MLLDYISSPSAAFYWVGQGYHCCHAQVPPADVVVCLLLLLFVVVVAVSGGSSMCGCVKTSRQGKV